MKKLFSTTLAAIFAVAVCVTEARAQTQIQLPFTTLATTAQPLVTNLADGWVTLTTNVTVTTFWSNAIAAMVTRTNTIVTTNRFFADFSAIGQTIVPLQFRFNWSAGNSNVVYFVSRSVNGIHYPTNLASPAVTGITNAGAGTTEVVAVDRVDMTGFNFGRIISFQLIHAGIGATFTNRSLIKGDKLQ